MDVAVIESYTWRIFDPGCVLAQLFPFAQFLFAPFAELKRSLYIRPSLYKSLNNSSLWLVMRSSPQRLLANMRITRSTLSDTISPTPLTSGPGSQIETLQEDARREYLDVLLVILHVCSLL